MSEGSAKEELLQHLHEANQPFTVDDLANVLGNTVKHDDDNKAITFLAMLLTFTEEDQINLGFLAESSSGKSYIPLELSWYFPQGDLIKLGYTSPTAFFHEHGLLLPDPTDQRPDVPEEKRRKIIHIDLHNKILIFLDQPHDQLLQRLRSLLSHDEKTIMLKITDKSQKYGLKTKTVIVEGPPTVIFCTAKFSMADQEKTRLLLLSPEINQEKLRESILLKIDKESDREAFKKRMDEDPKRKLLADRVDEIRTADIKYITVPEDLRNEVYKRFMSAHNFLIPRHQRDVSRLLSIIKGLALLNYMHRVRIGDSISANMEDVDAGFKLYDKVSEANELGLSPGVYNIFREIKEGLDAKGITISDFQGIYYRRFHKRLGYEDSRRILKTMASVGLLAEISDLTDKRIRRYTLLDLGVTTEAENYTLLDSGVASEDVNEKHPQAIQSIVSIPEAYEKLRNVLQCPFHEGKAFEAIAKLRGCDQAEAEKTFKVLVDDGKVFMDKEGLWSFG